MGEARCNPRVLPGCKHSGIEGGRSHGGDFFDVFMVTIDGDSTDGGRVPGADGEPMESGDSEGF